MLTVIFQIYIHHRKYYVIIFIVSLAYCDSDMFNCICSCVNTQLWNTIYTCFDVNSGMRRRILWYILLSYCTLLTLSLEKLVPSSTQSSSWCRLLTCSISCDNVCELELDFQDLILFHKKVIACLHRVLCYGTMCPHVILLEDLH